MPLLNFSALVGHLIRYDMIQNTDLVMLASPYSSSHEKETSIIEMIDDVGSKGFMLLYMCLIESSQECPAHKEAATILSEKGEH